MKYLIAGLGNPGTPYHTTRHNIGFTLLDHLANAHELTFSPVRLATQAHFKQAGRHIYLLKPMTYVNQSGPPIAYWLQQLKIPLHRLLVIVDDLALPFGTLRLRTKGSDGGHNGLKSIAEHLHTQAYARFRFGIGANFTRGQQSDYVLSPFTSEETEALPHHLQQAANSIATFWLPKGPQKR